MPSVDKPKTQKNSSLSRRRPVQSRSQQLVRDILEATAQVLEDVGLEALSTNKIARRAGVSIGSIYQYFADKDALLEAIVKDRYEQLAREVMDRLIDIMEQPLPVAATTCIGMYVDFLATQPELTHLLQSRLSQLTSVKEESNFNIDLDEKRALQLISTYLLRHAETLQLRDLEASAFMVYNTALLMGMKIAVQSPGEREALIPEIVRMISAYLGYENRRA